MNQTASGRIGHFHEVPYAMPGRENISADRTPVKNEVLTIDLTSEMKNGFSGNVLIQFKDGAITGILRPPRKPVNVDTKRLARSIEQAEYRIKNDYQKKLEAHKAGNLYSETEKMQKIIDQSKANVEAWRREIKTAEESERDYQAALSELGARIKAAVK